MRATTNWVWLLVRTLVDGEADLAAAHAVQDGFRLEAPAAPGPGRTFADRAAPWDKSLETIQALIAESPPRATDARLLAAIAPLGIGVKGGFDAARFTPAQAAEIEQGLAAARALLSEQGWTGPVVRGWSYPRADLGLYGQDYLYRARVALGGLGALPREEALYIRAVDPHGHATFAPGTRWRLRLPARLPLDGFWSLTLYRATPAGQFFLAENPIRRYAIGDRTPGLAWRRDLALDILVAAEDPGEGRRANWLPAPAAEPYGAVLPGLSAARRAARRHLHPAGTRARMSRTLVFRSLTVLVSEPDGRIGVLRELESVESHRGRTRSGEWTSSPMPCSTAEGAEHRRWFLSISDQIPIGSLG
ncbi:MAG: DUF1214 domain-containing protein [Sphingomonas sp.]